MAKATKHPRRGEPRKTRQPFSIDLLPMDVLETIKRLRAQYGMGWMEIERLSSLPYKADWEKKIGSAGFLDWDAMPATALKAFPDRKLPHSNLHRWYDVKVEQAQKEVLARAGQARVIAKSFAAATIAGADDAVLNAARDVIFEMLQTGDDRTRVKASAGLIALGEVMNGAKANTIKERKVAAEEKKLEMQRRDFELKIRKLEQETESAAKKLAKGDLTPEDIRSIRQRVFGS